MNDLSNHLSSTNWYSRFLNQDNLVFHWMLVVVFHDITDSHLSVREIVSLALVVPEIFCGSGQS